MPSPVIELCNSRCSCPRMVSVVRFGQLSVTNYDEPTELFKARHCSTEWLTAFSTTTILVRKILQNGAWPPGSRSELRSTFGRSVAPPIAFAYRRGSTTERRKRCYLDSAGDCASLILLSTFAVSWGASKLRSDSMRLLRRGCGSHGARIACANGAFHGLVSPHFRAWPCRAVSGVTAEPFT